MQKLGAHKAKKLFTISIKERAWGGGELAKAT